MPAHPAASPGAVVQPVPWGAVRLSDHIVAPRLAAAADHGLGALLERLAEHGAVEAFERLAFGAPDVERRGLWFTDSDIYKWVEAAAWHGRADLAETVVVAVTGAADDDGYLHTYYGGDARRPPERWSDLRGGHELYCLGHLIDAAVAAHTVLRDDRLLAAATRFAALAHDVFTPSNAPTPGWDGHPGVELALVHLFRVDGDDRWLDLAEVLLQRQGAAEHHTLGGHAVRALYLAHALTEVGLERPDGPWAEAGARLWTEMVADRSYLTGGVGGRWMGEALGRPYELPNEAAYAETCAACAAARWTSAHVAATGNAAAADHLETILHNALLGGVGVDGDSYTYSNPLASSGPGPGPAQARRLVEVDPWASPFDFGARAQLDRHPARREPWFDVTCCPTNVHRTLAQVPSWVAGTSDGALWVHLYLDGTISADVPGAGVVDLRVITRYPDDGRVVVRVEGAPDADVAIVLRLPAWSPRSRVAVNGEVVETDALRGDHVVIDATWQAGDEVQIDLDCAPRLVVADARIESTRGSAAIACGPRIYVAEAIDNPFVPDMLAVALEPTEPLRAGYEPGLLGGTTVVRAAGWSRPRPAGPTPYVALDELAALEAASRPEQLTFIPYSLWGNRGTHAFTVWMPLA